MTRGSAPGTSISRAHRSGTADRPMLRAATAGNSASRSSVQVKMQLTMCSASSAFRSMTSRTSSSVADRIASESLASTVVAPRSARSCIGRGLCQPTNGSTEDPESPGGPSVPLFRAAWLCRLSKSLDLPFRQAPALPRLQAAQAERAECHAFERHHPVPHRLEHPPDLALLALPDRDLEH